MVTRIPIGRQVNGAGVIYQIIGVVGNIKSRTLGEDLRPVLFRSLDQSVASDPSGLGYTLLVRTSGDAAALAPAVRSEVTTLDPTMAVFNIETMRRHLHDALFLPRLAGTLFGIFGFIGLLLASIGLYSVMSYSVSRRTQEIGIRMALGARTLAVQQLIVRQGMKLSLIAVLIGLAAGICRGEVLLQPALWSAAARSGDIHGRAGCVACGRIARLLDSVAASLAGRPHQGTAL